MSALTIMLLVCHDLNVADFLRSNKYQESRSKEDERMKKYINLVDYVKQKVVELYSDNPK